MNTITLKYILTSILCVAVFQTYGQSFPEDQAYRLKTYLASPDDFNASKTPPYLGQHIYPGVNPGADALTFSPKETSGSLQLFAFNPITGKTFEYPEGSGTMHQVYNIVSSVSGDGTNGTGVLELNQLDQAGQRMRLRGNAYPYDNDLSNFILVQSDNTTTTTFWMISAAVNTSTPYRFIQPDTNYGGFNFQGIAPDTRDGSDEWFLETAAGDNVVLSNEKFDTSSIFIANPVKNTLSIKGISHNVNQVSIYSLLGQEVLTEKVNAQSTLNLDTSKLINGLYLLTLKGDAGSFTKKFIKQ